jgi:7-cyano-7-deazaguanine synthase
VPLYLGAVGKAVCLLSGGLDSTVAAAWARERYELCVLHVGYGQRAAAREREAAEAIAAALGAGEFVVTSLPFLSALGGSALTDATIAIPQGALSEPGHIPITQVPFRNGIFLAFATALAEARRAEAVVIGAVEEDSSGYPDCREAFLSAFELAAREGTRPEVSLTLCAPLVHMRKSAIIRLGMELGAPLHLNWSCYGPGPDACGACESCLLRARGFREAGVPDPALVRR